MVIREEMLAGAAQAWLGIFGGLFALALLFLAAVWVLFPVLLLLRCNDILKELRGLRTEVKEGNNQRTEIAKGLQWMIDQKAEETSRSEVATREREPRRDSLKEFQHLEG